jgi:hypothetical protein
MRVLRTHGLANLHWSRVSPEHGPVFTNSPFRIPPSEAGVVLVFVLCEMFFDNIDGVATERGALLIYATDSLSQRLAQNN